MKRVKRICAVVALAAASLASGQQALAECGIASTYSSGRLTANGERYNHTAVSAAHKTLPFGTRVVVRNQRTGRSITVRINDRGPFVGGRIIDLSTGAKNALGMGGLAPVCLEVASFGNGSRAGRLGRRSESNARASLSHRVGKGSRRTAKLHRGVRQARLRHSGHKYAQVRYAGKKSARVRHRKGNVRRHRSRILASAGAY
jgi:rare lipoprotein A